MIKVKKINDFHFINYILNHYLNVDNENDISLKNIF